MKNLQQIPFEITEISKKYIDELNAIHKRYQKDMANSFLRLHRRLVVKLSSKTPQNISEERNND